MTYGMAASAGDDDIGPIVGSVVVRAKDDHFLGTRFGISQPQKDRIRVIDLKVLFGTGHRVLDVPQEASVDILWIRGKPYADILSLGDAVLGWSHGPFVYGLNIAERLVVADLRDRPRYRSLIGRVIFVLFVVSHNACLHPVIAGAMLYTITITSMSSDPEVPVPNFRFVFRLDDYIVPLSNVNDDTVCCVWFDWH